MPQVRGGIGAQPGKRGRRLAPGLLAGLLIAFGTGACQLIASIERVEKVAPPPPPPPVPTIPDPCAHRLVPPPPEPTNTDQGSVAPVYFAFRGANLVVGGGGLDLDGVCTCDARSDTAFDGGSTCTPRFAKADCDGDGGIDNQVGALFDALREGEDAAARGDLGESGMARGLRGVLLYLASWNGQPNDPDVDVGLIVSSGIRDPEGCGLRQPSGFDPVRYPPGWCGRDRWTYAPGTIATENGRQVPALRGKGYVKDGVLVYKQGGPLTFFLGTQSTTLGVPIVTGRLDVTDAGVRQISGVLAGRFAIGEFLAALGQSTGGVACRDDSFPLFKAAACNAVDISRAETFDRTNGPCDALSAALSFSAEQAELGGEADEEEQVNPCAPESVEPSLYKCDSD